MTAVLSPPGWARSMDAAERVKQRLRRATRALDESGVPYAVAGGNAVAEWVARIDEGATRNTKDVDLLVNRDDLSAIRDALAGVGFIYHNLFGVDTFIDGEKGKPSEGVHLLMAGEYVKPGDPEILPLVEESERAAEFQVVNLEALLKMKLIAYRRKDQVHILDLIGVGQIDATWPARFSPLLGERLQQLLDDPDG
jgi:hypothetical protein